MKDISFRTYPVKSRFFNIIYSDVDSDMRCLTIVCFWRGFQWEWMIKVGPGPHEHFEYRLFD